MYSRSTNARSRPNMKWLESLLVIRSVARIAQEPLRVEEEGVGEQGTPVIHGPLPNGNVCLESYVSISIHILGIASSKDTVENKQARKAHVFRHKVTTNLTASLRNNSREAVGDRRVQSHGLLETS